MKKRKVLYGLTALLLLGTPLATLASCGSDEPVTPTPPPVIGPSTPTDGIVNFDVALSLNEDNRAIKIGETINIICSNAVDNKGTVVFPEYSYSTNDKEIVSVSNNGTVKGLKEGTATISITCRGAASSLTPKTVTITVGNQADIATGGFSFVSSENPYKDKLDILGKLEKYAVEEHLTGITLFQNGGYVMYNDRIEKPTNNYITGYGYGILSEGKITKPMANESNEKWKNYYHSFGGPNNKQKFNYLDDTGSESADLYGYISSTYYSTKMNATKNGYEWFPLLAKDAKEAGASTEEVGNFDTKKPIPLNFNKGTGLATKYKVYLKTGKDGVKYSTLSNWDKVKGFNGREVQLEDYVTPFKLLLNQKMDLARSTDYISDTSNGTLRGAKAFYGACSTADIEDENLYGKNGLFYKLVGIEPNEKEGSITFTFNNPISPFEAMTNLSSSINSPIPVEFLKAIAPNTKTKSDTFKSAMNEAYGTTINRTELGPKDTTLSCGPYVVEETSDLANVFKRNDSYIERKDGRYEIEGVKMSYYQGAAQDKNFTFNKFIKDGVLDAVSIPKDYMKDFKDDKRTTTTEGDSTFKLNLNTYTQKEWNEAFKDNGGLTYDCEPLMSNDNFIDALSFALDRETFATSRGSVPSQSYFAPAYLWDPENGKPYDDTPQHKAVIAEYSPSTFGYNKTIAINLMDKAIEEEINKGNYESWTSTAHIDINWMNPTDTDEYGEEIKSYFDSAFAETKAAKKGFKLEIENHNGSTDYQHVYDLMKKGTFDIAFGSVSGMQLDPLGFFEVIKSNNVTGFTTNWGTDTSKISETNPIIYKGKKWSFDGLWDAANKGAIINSDGTVAKDPAKLVANKVAPGDSNVTIGGKPVDVKELAVNITVSAATSFRMFASQDEQQRKEEFVTLVVNYKEGKVPKSAALNLYYGQGLFDIYDPEDVNEIKDGDATLVVRIPKVLNSESTFGQIGQTINYSDIESARLYATCYMVINDVPTTTSLECEIKLKN